MTSSIKPRRRLAVLAAGACLAASAPAWAQEADVVAVDATRTGQGTWRFDVTVASPDTGWDSYADAWQVIAPDGTVLGTRELLHPHVNEQPFTRSLTEVAIPADIARVTVRARMKEAGYGGETVTVALDR